MEYRRNTHDVSKVKKIHVILLRFLIQSKIRYIIKFDENSNEVNLPSGLRF